MIPDRVAWLRAECSRPSHGYCSRHLSAEACPYAKICEQCDNFPVTAEFLPQLEAQLADAHALRQDAQARGWNSEVALHAPFVSLQHHLGPAETISVRRRVGLTRPRGPVGVGGRGYRNKPTTSAASSSTSPPRARRDRDQHGTVSPSNAKSPQRWLG